ncbi:MAG: hypothetical protein DCC67_09405 [Planctomycetota bacterium]|nr:MAG: hypothetical protein DCC67_09405 [Planctomycetota bacterium]
MIKPLRYALFVFVLMVLVARQQPSRAAVMTFPGLSAIRVTEYSGGPIPHLFLPTSPQMTTQLAFLNGVSNDFQGVPTEVYDVFYSDANGTFNLNGNYVTIEGRFAGQNGGGGLNIAAVDLLLGPTPFTVCRADILASAVGLGGNYIVGSEALAVDADAPLPVTFTTMGNTAGTSARMRVTVGWTKIIPEPASAALFAPAVAAFLPLVRRALAARKAAC